MEASSNGREVFRLAFGRRLHITGWKAVLLAPIAVPTILLILLAQRFLGLKATADLSAPEVENYLRRFMEGTDGEWDWDDFTSIPITDEILDRVREEAALVALPLDEQGEATLRRLLTEVRSM